MLIYWISDLGPGVSRDSAAYIDAAQNLLIGNGLFVGGRPMTHYPPGYPFLIWGITKLHTGDILQAIRFLCALLFSMNIILIGLAVHICTKQNLIATGLAMTAFLFSASVLSVHSMAWSEAPYITFSVASILLLSHHITRPRFYVLVLAALMTGVAAVTRYVGIVLLPTAVLAFYFLDNRSIKLKMRDMVLFIGIASLPLISWFIRNILIAQSETSRKFALHPIKLSHVKSFITTMHDFVLPTPDKILPIATWIQTMNVGLAFVLFIWGGMIIYRKAHNKPNVTFIGSVLSIICVIYSVIYILFLVISISFLDAQIPLDDRILLPIIPALTIAGIVFAWSLSTIFTRRFIWYGFIFFGLLSISINAIRATIRAVDIHESGRGYTSRYWNNSESIAYISDLPGGRIIYSNGPDVIRFMTGKQAIMIPQKVFQHSRIVNEDYEKQLNQMIKECREGKAIIVFFNSMKRWYLPSIKEIKSKGALPLLNRIQDDFIYGTQ